MCTCPVGMVGPLCSVADLCHPQSPCLNNGNCSSIATQTISQSGGAPVFSTVMDFSYDNVPTALQPVVLTVSSIGDFGLTSETATISGSNGFSWTIFGTASTDCIQRTASQTISASQFNSMVAGGTLNFTITFSNTVDNICGSPFFTLSLAIPAPQQAPVCACDPRYVGLTCETLIGECYSAPCLNGGSCVGSGAMLTFDSCMCAPGYTGITCESDIDEVPA